MQGVFPGAGAAQRGGGSGRLKGVRQDDPRHGELSKRLALLELKLRQAGLNTDFLRGEYADALLHKINQE